MTEQRFWRRCSNCKGEIALSARYWICSVSTCQRVRAPMQYCKPDCWAVHDEIENHRDGWAVEKTAPSTAEAEPSSPAAPSPRAAQPHAARPHAAPPHAAAPHAAAPHAAAPRASSPIAAAAVTDKKLDADEILVVASRFKEFLAEQHGVRCSDDALPILSAHLRKLARESIETARRASRKTLLDRDVARPRAEADVPSLVVVSRFKAFVTAVGDMRTSEEVIPVLTAELRRLGGQAAETAKRDGRKTVLGRDVPRP